MKTKYAGLLLVSAMFMAVPSEVLAEESTEAVAVEMTADEQQDMSLEEQLFGSWWGFSYSENGEIYEYGGADVTFFDGQVTYGYSIGSYELDGDTLSFEVTYDSGLAETCTGKIAFEEIQLTEELKEVFSEDDYAYLEENRPQVLTLTYMIPDNSNPLAPRNIEVVESFIRGENDSDFIEAVLFDAEWELDNGMKLALDTDGKATLTQLDGNILSGSEGSYYSDTYGFVLKFDPMSSLRYTIVNLTANEITMHLEDDPTSITHMTRIQN